MSYVNYSWIRFSNFATKTLPSTRRLRVGSKRDSSQFLLSIPLNLDLPPIEEPPNEISEALNNIFSLSPRNKQLENSPTSHKFLPHLWRPKFCRICYCTLEEHDDVETPEEQSPSPTKGRSFSLGRTSLISPVSNAHQYFTNVFKESQQIETKNSLNNWIKQNIPISNSLNQVFEDLNYVDQFKLSSLSKDYKDEITLTAHIVLKKNYQDIELNEKNKSPTNQSKSDDTEEIQFKEKLEKLKEKEQILKEKEQILKEKESELNSRLESLKILEEKLKKDELLGMKIGLSTSTDVTNDELERVFNFEQTKEDSTSGQSDSSIVSEKSNGSNDSETSQLKEAVSHLTIQTLSLIKKTKGFTIWQPREKLEMTRDSLLTFEFPEHDIFYYRDNFLINPSIYQVLESCVQNYSAEMGHFLEAVDATFFFDHVNLISDEPIIFIASIRKVPDVHGNFPGIVRTKLGDRPFILDGLEWKKKGSTSTSELVAAFRKHFTCFGKCKLLAVETMYLDEKNEEIKNRSRSNSLTSYLGNGKANIKNLKNSEGKLSLSGGKSKKYLPVELLELDRKLKVQTYKLGVLYVKNSDETKETILSRQLGDVDPNFFKFMEFLGRRIKLKGWKGYRADLDTNNNSSGTDSYYCDFETTSIMYHCSPLLSADEREKLIGNDLISIVYIEKGEWDASKFESQVTHGYLVVRPVVQSDNTLKVRVSFTARKGVPETHPFFPDQSFVLDDNFRKAFLCKCINMERASWKCPTTIRKQQRALRDHYWAAREGHLRYLATEHLNSEHGKEYF